MMNPTREAAQAGPAIAPRPEAGVLTVPPSEKTAVQYRLREDEAPPALTVEQNDVALRVLGLVNDMATPRTLSRHETPRFLPRIEPKRESRVILIDGDSGSGKTSILVTLVDYWSRRIAPPTQQPAGELVDADVWPAPPVPVFPVGILDLQPLPPSTNLLLHVASALSKVIDMLAGEFAPSAAAPPWHPVRQRELRSRQRWREFVKAAAAGSDGNLQQRRDLDPEAFALELEQAERERLDVADAFFNLVDELIKDLIESNEIPGRKPPFLVLSIDDADMNPHFSVALLNLLRSLYHPRLAYLLTGNSSLFVTMLRMHLFGTLFRPIEGLALDRTDEPELQHESDVLASLTYDRLLPNHQRCRIEPLVPAERLRQLREALSLAQLRTSEPLRSNTVVAYFELVNQIESALPPSMRAIVDLRAHLFLESCRAPEGGRVRLTAWLVKDLWDAAVGSAFLTTDERHALESCVRINDRGNLDCRSRQINLRPTWIYLFRVPLSGPLTGLCSELGPVAASLTMREKPARSLSSRVTAAYMLAQLVTLDDPQDVFFSETVSEQPFDATLMRIEYNRKDTGQLFFGWPLPPKTLLLDLLIIAGHWATVMGMADASTRIEQLAVFFLEAVIATARTRQPGSVKLRTDLGSDIWNELAEGLKSLIDPPPNQTCLRTTRQRLFAQWARDKAGLLAAPESGLPPGIAQKVLDTLDKAVPKAQRGSARAGLREARRERARFALKNARSEEKEDKLLADIDKEFGKSPWVKMFGKVRAPRSSAQTRRRQHRSQTTA